jgi:hypothetical protein
VNGICTHWLTLRFPTSAGVRRSSGHTSFAAGSVARGLNSNGEGTENYEDTVLRLTPYQPSPFSVPSPQLLILFMRERPRSGIVHDTPDPLLHRLGAEVEEQSDAKIRQAQIGQELLAMHGGESVE